MKSLIHTAAGFFVSVAVVLLILLIILSFYGRLMCDTIDGPSSYVVTCIIMMPK